MEKKELQMLLLEVSETVNEIEKDINAFTYQKEKLGIDYHERAVELRTQLLKGYALKADLIRTLYRI